MYSGGVQSTLSGRLFFFSNKIHIPNNKTVQNVPKLILAILTSCFNFRSHIGHRVIEQFHNVNVKTNSKSMTLIIT